MFWVKRNPRYRYWSPKERLLALAAAAGIALLYWLMTWVNRAGTAGHVIAVAVMLALAPVFFLCALTAITGRARYDRYPRDEQTSTTST